MDMLKSLIPESQIPIDRRIAEAVAARLNYDFLCFRGAIMGEAYLGHSICEIFAAFFDQRKYRARNNFAHPVLFIPEKRGRKPEIDYVVEDLNTGTSILAIEAKWAGSSHCSSENILWDLVRLKLLTDESKGRCSVYFLMAGRASDFDKVLDDKFFKYGTEHPLNHGSSREKKFRLVENKHHQAFIDKQKSAWAEKYSDLLIPERLTTRMANDDCSGNRKFRFIAKIWSIT